MSDNDMMINLCIMLGDDLATVEQCESIFERHDCELLWREKIPTVKHGSEYMWDIEYAVSHCCLEAVCRELTNAGFKYTFYFDDGE
jgi:hypothetical protein